MHKVDIQLLGKEYDKLKKIDKLNLTAIDIGDEAINRTNGWADVITIVNQGNPANETGIITSIEIWAHLNMSNVEVATFFVVSGNNLSTRDTHTIGSVTAGSKQTFSGLNLSVQAGDYIGISFSAGSIECDSSGSGNWNLAGDNIPCTDTTFTSLAGWHISLYGTGATPAAGWPHKWNGITIGKLNGAVITKWNGI